MPFKCTKCGVVLPDADKSATDHMKNNKGHDFFEEVVLVKNEYVNYSKEEKVD